MLCELIEPYKGIVYDGACGSGGMFVQSAKFINEHKGNKKEISVYGQEYTATTLKLASSASNTISLTVSMHLF